MYDNVKRRRGCESQEDACDDEEEEEEEEEDSEQDGDDDDDDEEDEEGDDDKPSYCLRKVRRVVNRYEAPPMSKHQVF